jgi:phospholipid/cholesterol/gamma-HCH transport system substrate-binding protein
MKIETKVGLLFIGSVLLIAIFAYFMGILNPFSSTRNLNVMYNYAGGLEEGSPVRVMGIKVGKVKKINFEPDFKMGNGEEVKLQVVIAIEKKAWTSIRKDSKFFINLAGVIGEKFLEISPGSLSSEESYGLAGKIIQMVEKNEGSVTNMIGQLDRLLTNFNRTLSLLDKTSKDKEMSRLLDNAVKISDDLAYLTGSLRSKKAEDSYALLHKLLFRLEGLDGPAIRKFLQEEGVKAKIF